MASNYSWHAICFVGFDFLPVFQKVESWKHATFLHCQESWGLDALVQWDCRETGERDLKEMLHVKRQKSYKDAYNAIRSLFISFLLKAFL